MGGSDDTPPLYNNTSNDLVTSDKCNAKLMSDSENLLSTAVRPRTSQLRVHVNALAYDVAVHVLDMLAYDHAVSD